MIRLEDDKILAILQSDTEVFIVDELSEISKHEIIKLQSYSGIHKCFVHVIEVKNHTVFDALSEGIFTIDQIESWIGKLKSQREAELRDHYITYVQCSLLDSVYGKLCGSGLKMNLDIAYAFLHKGETDNEEE